MPKITVKFDDKLPKHEITITETNSSTGKSGDYFMKAIPNKTNISQHRVYGIMAPLISINGIAVDFSDIIFFSLKNTGVTPQLYIEIYDRHKLISYINTPRMDNLIVVQILPQSENTYKKINLSFFISNINISNGNVIKINGSYKVIDLVSKRYMCLGQMTTYQLIEHIAKETKLGFASNWVDETKDKRYMYCANESYLDLLNREIKNSLSDKNKIFECWVDYWNYLNFINIQDRYETIENLDNKENWIWVTSQQTEMTPDNEIIPFKMPLKLTNHPTLNNTELFVDSYEIVNKSAKNYSRGTDIVYGIYEENKGEYIDHLYQDGDVKMDIFQGTEYLGENYGDYNYILAGINRDTFLKKMQIETVKVTLAYPLLALNKGLKVDFIWYDNNSMLENINNNLSNGIIKKYEDIETNIPLDELTSDEQKNFNSANGDFKIDKSISGQYTVLNTCLYFKNLRWFYDVTLGRPYKDKPEILTKKIY